MLFISGFLISRPAEAVAGSAALSWTANDPADGVVSYNVYFRTSTENYGNPINAGNVTDHTLSDLPEGHYFFVVTAVDGAGNESEFSSPPAEKTILPPPDTASPVVSSIIAANISTTSATIFWSTNENADSQIQYGTSTIYGLTTSLDASLTANHSQGLIGLEPATLYHYRVLSRDASGNLTPSADNTFTTSNPVDVRAPAISNVTVANLSDVGASISWNTDEPSTAQLEYWTTVSDVQQSPTQLVPGSIHAIDISALVSGTTYHFRVLSQDIAGNLASSGNFSFSTLTPPDTSSPIFSDVSVTGLTETGVLITWNTDEAATSHIEYGSTSDYGQLSSLETSLLTHHRHAISALTSSTTYHYRLVSTDALGNQTIGVDRTLTTLAEPDDTSPVLSAFTESGLTTTSIVISWHSDEAATSQIRYGTTAEYGELSTRATSLLSEHSHSISGLAESTTYHYQLINVDAAGNQTTEIDRSFTTLAVTNPTAPLILGITEGTVTTTGALIRWDTDEAATSQIQFGTTGAYGESSLLNETLLFSHVVSLSDLKPATIYHYRVLSRSANGSLSVSENHSFRTSDLVSIPPIDTVPPADVINFTAVGQNGRILLSWINPGDNDFVGARIRFRTDHPPKDINDGVLLGDIGGEPNQLMAMNHTGLTNGVTYYYLAESYDGSGNFQTTVFDSATPVEDEIVKLELPDASGGCGMIKRGDGGDGPGPEQAAEMIGMLGIILFLLSKKIFMPGKIQISKA